MKGSTQAAEILNNYFINIVEINTENELHISLLCTEKDELIIKQLTRLLHIDPYSNHPSVTSIESNLVKNPQAFSFKRASSSDIEKNHLKSKSYCCYSI